MKSRLLGGSRQEAQPLGFSALVRSVRPCVRRFTDDCEICGSLRNGSSAAGLPGRQVSMVSGEVRVECASHGVPLDYSKSLPGRPVRGTFWPCPKQNSLGGEPVDRSARPMHLLGSSEALRRSLKMHSLGGIRVQLEVVSSVCAGHFLRLSEALPRFVKRHTLGGELGCSTGC